jgi:exodeoxyribonuclease VII large subunit
MTLGNNVPELTVSELALSLKRTLEDTYARVRVRGELSKVKLHSSGHLYSDLKDKDSVLNIICWRGQLAKLSVQPAEGLEVICTGRITSYPARSNYQMIIEEMELAGAGAILKMLEDRKRKLAAEGLFDDKRKKKIPFLPDCIGVITSPTGAVIRDILHRVEDRFPRPILLWPVRVQGEGAAEEIVSAIKGFQAIDAQSSIPKPDVIIVARGGGSLEDLMPFNDEAVVRAVADCPIPIISAVGHETDTTLIDYAADVRAPTPTAAAEMAVPERIHLAGAIESIGYRLQQSLMQKIKVHFDLLRVISSSFKQPERLFEYPTQRLDSAIQNLKYSLGGLVQGQHNRLLRVSGGLKSPIHRLEREVQNYQYLGEALRQSALNSYKMAEHRLETFSKLIEVLSFKSVLRRGFALIRDEDGSPLASIQAIQPKSRVMIEMQDGIRHSIVEE